jgi:soluble lytic murein transglycosylase-like protein
MCNGTPCFKNRPTTQQLLDPEFNVSYGTNMLKNLINGLGSIREGLLHYGPTDYGYAYADKVIGIYQANNNVCQ